MYILFKNYILLKQIFQHIVTCNLTTQFLLHYFIRFLLRVFHYTRKILLHDYIHLHLTLSLFVFSWNFLFVMNKKPNTSIRD